MLRRVVTQGIAPAHSRQPSRWQRSMCASRRTGQPLIEMNNEQTVPYLGREAVESSSRRAAEHLTKHVELLGIAGANKPVVC